MSRPASQRTHQTRPVLSIRPTPSDPGAWYDRARCTPVSQYRSMSPICPSCGEPTLDGASFYEACGADVVSGPACVSCHALVNHIDGDYCLQCGHRQPGARDHLEVVEGRIAGTTDRERRHHRNEDAMVFADTTAGLVMVVCDGVSTTDRPDEAS